MKPIGPLSYEDAEVMGSTALVAEINFRRGQVMGLDARVKELEEKFAIALEYQREKDARIVEQNTFRVEIDIVPERPWPIVITESKGKPLHDLIRETPIDY